MPTGGGGGGSNSIGGWPLTFFGAGFSSSDAPIPTNQVSLSGFELSYPLTFSKLSVNVATADAVNLYDSGIYSAAGVLKANTGPRHLPSTVLQTDSTLQGSITLQPGLYLIAHTGNDSTAHLSYNYIGSVWFFNSGYAASAGGTLPSTITAPTRASAVIAWYFQLSA